jgi:hypothetical protein
MRPPFDASAWHELVSENTIRKALATYCRAMDRIDAPLGYTVWHDDGLADYGSYFTGTGHAFVDKVCRFHRRLAAHAHHVTNMLIDVKDDRAASEAYVYVALLAASDQGHVLTTVSGRYLDRWSFRHGRWAPPSADGRFPTSLHAVRRRTGLAGGLVDENLAARVRLPNADNRSP